MTIVENETPPVVESITPPPAEDIKIVDTPKDEGIKITFSDSPPDNKVTDKVSENETKDNAPKDEKKVDDTKVNDKAKDDTKVTFDFKSKFGEEWDSEEKVAEVLKSYKDLKTKAEKAALLESVPEHSKGLIEFVAKGGDAKTYVEAMSKDYDKLDEKSSIKEYYMLQNKAELLKKGFNEKMIDLKFEQEFKKLYGEAREFDPDYDAEDDKDLIEMQRLSLKNDAEDVKAFLKEQQKEAIKTPEKKIEESNKKWLDTVAETAKNFKGLNLKVAGEELTFKNETPEKLRDSMAGIDYNPETHAKAMYLAANFEKIIAEVEKKATEKAYKQGQADYQKKLANPQNLKDETSPKVPNYSGNTWTAEEANQAAKNGGITFRN